MRSIISLLKKTNTAPQKKFQTNNLRRFVASLLLYAQLIQVAAAAVLPVTPVRQQQNKELQSLSLNSQQLGLTGPLSAGATYSNLTGTFFNAQYIMPLGRSFAFGALGEYGANQYRLNGTLGYEIAPLMQMKFSAERLGQRLPFQFDSGTIHSRINQDAYGARLQKLFNLRILQGINAGGYYADASDKSLNPVIFISNGLNCNGFESGLTCINYRHITGGKSSGGDIGADVLLTPSTWVKGNLYYDSVRYDTHFANTENQNRNGFGAGVKINQLLNNHLKLAGEATAREIYDLYQVGFSWLPKTPKLGMELSLMGQHVTSHNATPDNTSITAQLSLLMDGNKNYNERFNWGNQRLTEIAQWVKAPAVHMEQVLAIAEQITLLLAPTITSISPDTGPFSGGNSVTISGSNFAPGLLVYIGGMLAVIQSVSTTSIQVIVPPSSGSTVVDVTVQNPDGQRTTLRTAYHYTSPTNLPSVTAIAPDTGSTSGGTPVVITGINFQGATSVTIGGVPITNLVVNSNGTQITGVTGAHIQANGVPVIVTTSAGSSSGGPTYTYQLGAPLVISPTDGSTLNNPTPGFDGTGEPGATVSVKESSNTLCTSLVDNTGNWSCTSSPLVNGVYPIEVTQQDTFGTISPATNLNITISITAPTAPIITSPASGTILNQITIGQDLLVTGTGEAGAELLVTLNSVIYSSTVQSDNSWSVTIPASDLTALVDGTYTLSAVQTNSEGQSPTTSQPIIVNTIAPHITIDPVLVDDVINHDEAAAPIHITGTTDAESGQTVTVSFLGENYTGQVTGGTWGVTIPANTVTPADDGTHLLSASVSNEAGNTANANKNIIVAVTLPTITINPINGTNSINAVQASVDTVVSGTSTAPEGSPVIVTIDVKTYSTSVNAGGEWSLNVPPSDIELLPDGVTAFQATVTDAYGNSSFTQNDVQVIIHNLPTININTVADDDIITAAKAAAPITISGTSTAGEGQSVSVDILASTFTALIQADGTWSFDLPANFFTVDGAVDIQGSTIDSVGNVASTNHPITVDLS